jgi:hypothetical protein
MRRALGKVTSGLLTVGLLAAACGGGGGGGEAAAAFRGTYRCPTGSAVDTRILRPDGSLELRQDSALTIKGTWSAEGDAGPVVMTLEGKDERFTVEGSRLVMITGGGGRYVCDRVNG